MNSINPVDGGEGVDYGGVGAVFIATKEVYSAAFREKLWMIPIRNIILDTLFRDTAGTIGQC